MGRSFSFPEISELIAALRAAGDRARGLCTSYANPTPLAPPRLASLRGPGDTEVPADLREWLAYDATWLPLFDDDGAWRTTSPRAFAEAEVAEVAEELGDLEDWSEGAAIDGILASLDDPALADAPSIRLPDSASQAHLLVFGGPRLYVLGYEKEELWIKYHSFPEFLKAYFSLET